MWATPGCCPQERKTRGRQIRASTSILLLASATPERERASGLSSIFSILFGVHIGTDIDRREIDCPLIHHA